MTLRVGIVSAAWGGFAHLPAWRAIKGVEVTAICTSRRETAEVAAARLGIARSFWNAEAMCADADIDIVDLGTRPVRRAPMIMAALAHGKHIYNACPHAPDWETAKAIDAAWRDSVSVAVVDAFSQWVPAHAQMKAMLDDSAIGAPLGGSCRFNISLFNAPDKRFPYNWFGETGQGVSAVRNNGGHLLYMLLHLFGPIAELVADDLRVLDEWRFADGDTITPETNDFANIILRFESGLSLPMQACWSMPAHDGWEIDVFGGQGRLCASAPTFPTARDCVLEAGQTGGVLQPVEIDDRYKHIEGIALDWQAEVQPAFPMALSMQAMVGAIERGGTGAPDFARAFAVERVQEAIRVSSIERRWVRVDDVI